MSPSGYAAETPLARFESPDRWMFGATRKTHEGSANPTVRINESIAAAVAARISPADEQEQSGDERRVDRQIDRVAERGEADVGAEELRVAVRVEVAGEVEELPEDEQHPRCARPGL